MTDRTGRHRGRPDYSATTSSATPRHRAANPLPLTPRTPCYCDSAFHPQGH